MTMQKITEQSVIKALIQELDLESFTALWSEMTEVYRIDPTAVW